MAHAVAGAGHAEPWAVDLFDAGSEHPVHRRHVAPRDPAHAGLGVPAASQGRGLRLRPSDARGAPADPQGGEGAAR
eukprot:3620132-Pyramimonas_sp.AAC.1